MLQFKLKKKRRWCAWDSNPGRQNGKGQTNSLSYGGTPICTTLGLRFLKAHSDGRKICCESVFSCSRQMRCRKLEIFLFFVAPQPSATAECIFLSSVNEPLGRFDLIEHRIEDRRSTAKVKQA